MSSLGAPDAIKGSGIFDVLPGGLGSPLVNSFRDYNHVLVHYCSSDNWIGSQSHRAGGTAGSRAWASHCARPVSLPTRVARPELVAAVAMRNAPTVSHSRGLVHSAKTVVGGAS
jgi:hypothetical protein